MSRLFLLAMALAVSQPASAQTPLPDLDLRANCAEAFAREDMQAACLKAQTQNRIDVAPMWRATTEEIRQACLRRGPRITRKSATA